ncbi:MAG: PAS domain S-box protein [Dechloromonas sp.]|nr:PAS domain S-box protein [Dechloromonas sp.]
MPGESVGGSADHKTNRSTLTSLAVYAVALALTFALLGSLYLGHVRDRETRLQAVRDATGGAANRLTHTLDQQRLEIRRQSVAAGFDPELPATTRRLADLTADLQRRMPEVLSLELLDADASPLAHAGMPLDSDHRDRTRALVAAGQSGAFLSLAGDQPRYELVVPVALTAGPGALRIAVAESVLASPLEWFEPQGYRLYLVHSADPAHPLLAAQRPFDLNKGMPPNGSIVPVPGSSVAVTGTDWSVVAAAADGAPRPDAGRYLALGVVGLLLLWSTAWLAVERLRSASRRAQERLASEQRYMLHLEGEVAEQTRDLLAARDRLEEAQHIALVGSYDYDIAADRWSASPVLEDILGIDHAYPRTLAAWNDLSLPGERPAAAAELAARLQDGATWERTCRICRPADGEIRWVHLRGEFTRERDGRPTHLRGTVQDVSHLKAVEDALRDSESRANLILDRVPEGILVVASDGRIVRLNPEAERMFGYAAGELLGQAVETLIPTAVRRAHRSLREGFPPDSPPRIMGQGRHLKALRRDGREFHVEIGLGPVVIGGEPHVIVIVSDVSQRIAAELDLRRFREVLDTSVDLLAFVDPGLRYGISNPAYAAQFGMTPADIHGRPLAEVLPAALFNEVEPYLRRALTGEAVGYVTSRRIPAGEEKLYEADYRPFRTAAGIEGVVVSLHDVTQRVQTELALRESELKARAMLNTPFLNLGLLDASGRIVVINDTALSAARTRLEDLAGRPFWECPWYDHDEAMRLRVRQGVETAASGQADRFEITSSLRSGEVRFKDFIVQPVQDGNGRIVWITVQSTDITERVLARKSLEAQQEKLESMVAERTAELTQSEEQFRGLVEQPLVSIYILCEGRFAYVNPAFATLFGYDDPEAMIGRLAIIDLVAPEEREHVLNRVQARIDKRERIAQYSFTALRRDGSRFEIEVQGRAFDYQGKPAVIGVATDITERRRLEMAREAALAEARRLAAARSEFLANMSHEIRTPLNAVLGLAQVGLRDSRGRQIAGSFRRILDSGQTLLTVVNDILDYSKIEAGKLKLENAPFDLGQVIDRATAIVAPQAYGKGLELEVFEAPDLAPRYVGDSVRLTQVLINLLSNAVKFTPSGRITLAASARNGELLLSVTDTGIGIPSAEIGRLFQPFEQADGSTTRRFGGTGLGLSIVHSLVHLMGGDIHVLSDTGQGSRFEVVLPLSADGEAPQAAPLQVVLVGFAPDSAIVAALAARGHGVKAAAAAEAFDCGADLVLLDAALASDPAVATLLLDALATGDRTVVVATTPGGKELPAVLRDRCAVVERPLRPAKILAALEAGGADHALEAAQARLPGVAILAAEDNEVNRLVLEEMLIAEGALLTLAEDGLAALEIVEREGAGAFQVVLTDIQMPRLDGYGLAQRLRQIAPELPVVGLTAHAMPEERERCLAAGMVEHLTKPVDLELLVSTLQLLAGRSTAAPEDARALPTGGAHRSPAMGIPDRAVGAASIDWAGLENRFRGKADFIRRLLHKFESSYHSAGAELRRVAKAGDYEALSFQAHTLKGVFGNLVFTEAVAHAARTDQLARQRDPAALVEALALAERTEALLEQVRQQLQKQAAGA